MKKSMIAFGVAALCGAVSFADVTSANIVGYTTSQMYSVDEELTTKFNMIAVPFNSVAGEGIDLNDGSLQTKNLVEGYGVDGSCDVVQIYDPSIQDYTRHFYYVGDGWTDDSGNGWFVDDYPDGLPAGSAMWIELAPNVQGGETVREAPLELTFSGSVEGEGDVGYELYTGEFNMLSNPFPVAWFPDDIRSEDNETGVVKWDNLIEGYGVDGSCDVIQIFDPEIDDYTRHFFYVGDGWTDDSGNGYFEDDYPDGIPAAGAFWLETTADHEDGAPLTVTFFNPIK